MYCAQTVPEMSKYWNYFFYKWSRFIFGVKYYVLGYSSLNFQMLTSDKLLILWPKSAGIVHLASNFVSDFAEMEPFQHQIDLKKRQIQTKSAWITYDKKLDMPFERNYIDQRNPEHLRQESTKGRVLGRPTSFSKDATKTEWSEDISTRSVPRLSTPVLCMAMHRLGQHRTNGRTIQQLPVVNCFRTSMI